MNALHNIFIVMYIPTFNKSLQTLLRNIIYTNINNTFPCKAFIFVVSTTNKNKVNISYVILVCTNLNYNSYMHTHNLCNV